MVLGLAGGPGVAEVLVLADAAGRVVLGRLAAVAGGGAAVDDVQAAARRRERLGAHRRVAALPRPLRHRRRLRYYRYCCFFFFFFVMVRAPWPGVPSVPVVADAAGRVGLRRVAALAGGGAAGNDVQAAADRRERLGA